MLFDPNATDLPKRKELPRVEGTPEGSAWFWGKDDQLGRLNLLTKERVLEATKLIKTGETVGLNWQANLPYPAMFGRQNFKYEVYKRSESSYDDIYSMNTQSGSQWDGFRHVGHTDDNGTVFYNGAKASQFDNSSTIGIQAWAERGLAGRAVLIDYWTFKQKSYDPLSTHAINVADIQACAKEQGVTFQKGDILMIRSGWTDNYSRLSQSEREKLETIPTMEYKLVGCEQSEEMHDFLYDNYFAAVVGDTPAFEAWPPKREWGLHRALIAMWGSPIGELWDLDRLAEMCKEKNQYAFFVTSAPSNMPGGIGSCPNAMAIF